jgi:hypothetical protein
MSRSELMVQIARKKFEIEYQKSSQLKKQRSLLAPKNVLADNTSVLDKANLETVEAHRIKVETRAKEKCRRWLT